MFPVVLSRTNTRMHLAEVYTGDGGEPVLDRDSYFALYGWLGLYFPNSQNTKYGKKVADCLRTEKQNASAPQSSSG